MTWMLQDEAANPYLDVCQYAAKSNEFFKRFKSHPAYTHVLDRHGNPPDTSKRIVQCIFFCKFFGNRKTITFSLSEAILESVS